MWGERRGRWLSSHWQMAPQRRNVFSSCRRQPSWDSSNIPMLSLYMGSSVKVNQLVKINCTIHLHSGVFVIVPMYLCFFRT